MASRVSPLLLAGCLAACSGGAEETGRTPATGERVLTYDRRSFANRTGGCDVSDEAPCGSFSAVYPEFVGPAAASALNEAVMELLLTPILEDGRSADLHELSSDFLVAYEAARAEFPDAATTSRWYVERNVDVLHEDPRVISVRVVETSYTGGAHPNSRVRLASFDAASGERLELDDLLVAGGRARLDEIGERRFREVRSIPPEQGLRDAGFFFEEDAFALNGNFAVTDTGLLFHFDAYEIGPYAAGPTDVDLAWDELGDLVEER